MVIFCASEFQKKFATQSQLFCVGLVAPICKRCIFASQNGSGKKAILEVFPCIFMNFISDKLMKIIDEKIFILDSGRLFTRNISMRFDPLVSKKIGTYSRTI